MALADFMKACSLSDSTFKASSSTTATHVLGFLSLLAISGSLALFTFAGNNNSNKLKLSAAEASSRPLIMDGSDGSPTAESRSLKTEGAASQPSKIDGVKSSRKRVRFADDVVEPRGNSHEYRQRFAARQLHEERVGRSNSMPANRMALYRGLRQHRLQHSAAFFS